MGRKGRAAWGCIWELEPREQRQRLACAGRRQGGQPSGGDPREREVGFEVGDVSLGAWGWSQPGQR